MTVLGGDCVGSDCGDCVGNDWAGSDCGDWTWQWLGLAMIGLAVTELLPVVRCRVAGV